MGRVESSSGSREEGKLMAEYTVAYNVTIGSGSLVVEADSYDEAASIVENMGQEGLLAGCNDGPYVEVEYIDGEDGPIDYFG